jgi:hypothetical protein
VESGSSQVRRKRGKRSRQLSGGDARHRRRAVGGGELGTGAGASMAFTQQEEDEDHAFSNTKGGSNSKKRQLLLQSNKEVGTVIIHQEGKHSPREEVRMKGTAHGGSRALLLYPGMTPIGSLRHYDYDQQQALGLKLRRQALGLRSQEQVQVSVDDDDDDDSGASRRQLMQGESLGILDLGDEEGQDMDTYYDEEGESGRRRGRVLMEEDAGAWSEGDGEVEGGDEKGLMVEGESGGSHAGGMKGIRMRRRGGRVGVEEPFVWEADAQELMQHVLHQISHEQVVYLRRPVVVDWGHPQDGSELKNAKER